MDQECEHGTIPKTECGICAEDFETYQRVRFNLLRDQQIAGLERALAVAQDDLRQKEGQLVADIQNVQTRLTDMDKTCEGLQIRVEEFEQQLAAQARAHEEALRQAVRLQRDAQDAARVAEELWNDAAEKAVILEKEILGLRRLFGSKRDDGPSENATFVAEQIAQLHATALAKRNLDLEKQLVALTRELETMSAGRTRALSAAVNENMVAMAEVMESTLRKIRPRAKLNPNPVVVANDVADAVHTLLEERREARKKARSKAPKIVAAAISGRLARRSA